MTELILCPCGRKFRDVKDYKLHWKGCFNNGKKVKKMSHEEPDMVEEVFKKYFLIFKRAWKDEETGE